MLNTKQKRVIVIGFVIIGLSFIIWILYGGEIFTKTETLVEVKDELFGTIKEWREQFIWGLDLTGIVSLVTVGCCGVLLFLFRSKKQQSI